MTSPFPPRLPLPGMQPGMAVGPMPGPGPAPMGLVDPRGNPLLPPQPPPLGAPTPPPTAAAATGLPPSAGMAPPAPLPPPTPAYDFNPQDFPGIDPELVKRVLNQVDPPKPRYRPGYQKPSKPDPMGVAGLGKMRWEDMRPWRTAVYSDMIFLRMLDSGIFEDDKALYEAKIMDDYVDTSLVADFNLAWQILSGMEIRYKKQPRSRDMAMMCRQYATAMKYLREREEISWEVSGNGNLLTDEAKHLLIYGMVVKRRTLDDMDPDYPFDPFLVDPCSSVAEYDGKRGLRRWWRVYNTTIGSLTAAYGDLVKPTRDALADKIGSAASWDDDTEVQGVVEYWDSWHCCVVLPGGREVVKMYEHELGVVPVTIGYGPLGEPMGIQTPIGMALGDNSADNFGVETDRQYDRIFKSVGFIRYAKEAHKVNEAIIRRALYGIKKSLDPATLVGRSPDAMENPMEDLESTPGAKNEYLLGEEKIDPFVPGISPIDMQSVMQAITSQNQSIMFPPGSHGIYDKSNISGIAQGNAVDIGADRIMPWTRTLSKFIERDTMLSAYLFRNFGWEIKYGGDEITPLTIPMETRRGRGTIESFELTRELIDAVGPTITIKMSKSRKQDLVPLAQTAKLLNDMGLPFAYLAEEWFDIDDYEFELFDEWIEEQNIRQAFQLPEFAKGISIPMSFDAEIEQSTGDPKRQAVWRKYAAKWQELTAIEQQQQQADAQAQMSPPQQGPQGMNPPTAAGISYPSVGQGPSSVTGQPGGNRAIPGVENQGSDVGP